MNQHPVRRPHPEVVAVLSRHPVPEDMRPDLVEYLAARIQPGPGCWPWLLRLNQWGYGLAVVLPHRPAIGQRRRSMVAHRIVHILAVGPVAEGLDVDHRCHMPMECGRGVCSHRGCCNPEHLVVATRAENTGRDVTHCQRGHEFTPENTRLHPEGYRLCRECLRQRGRERYHRSVSA